jgi:hypothetical protein
MLRSEWHNYLEELGIRKSIYTEGLEFGSRKHEEPQDSRDEELMNVYTSESLG